ncbi:MAG: GTP 3',8-cyclase MoaA [Deltaproteobacteria bacterium]|nr:GTP 3',8-cyclase MoaA [Deltaproteobacteria bacterium]
MNPHDLLGRPLGTLRLSVTDRCNFRCVYCLPPRGNHPLGNESPDFSAPEQVLTDEEILRLAGIFAGLGAARVRVTGGEPLLRPGVSRLVAGLTALPGVEEVALTTNGWHLAAQAQALKQAGLKRVTVSLDSLDPKVFARMNGGRGHPERVVEGIHQALAQGLTPLKINTVVQRGVNDHGLEDLAQFARETGAVLRLIEYMDAGTLHPWNAEQVVPSAEIRARLARRFGLEPLETEPGMGGVASRYRYGDGKGEVGFISSITQPFCAGCTRARLSAAGVFYTCLFAREGLNLREPLRQGASNQDLARLIASQWTSRSDRYSEQRGLHPPASGRRVSMHQVGG